MQEPSNDPGSEPNSDTTGSLAARSGDDPSGAFAGLYRRVAPALFAWASLHLHEPLRVVIDPEDVLQEVACRGYEHFGSYDPARGDFRAWMFGIARNVLYQAMDRLRGASQPPKAAGPALDLPDTATSITSRVARDEGISRFVEAVRGMPDEDQRLLVYRGLEGLAHGEVAELMGLSVEAVSQRWSRLRARLREEGGLGEFLAD